MPRARVALIVLNLSAILVVVGGSYDLLVPALPPHQLAFLGMTEDQLEPRTAQLLQAMFRALGGCLIAVGIGALFLINSGLRRGHHWATVAVITMVALGAHHGGLPRAAHGTLRTRARRVRRLAVSKRA